MKKIKIAHLYYDLMNLYGENGNIRYLVKSLGEQGIDVEVHFLSMEDKIDFKKYDFYYIGMGSEENKMLVPLITSNKCLSSSISNTVFLF